MAKIELWVPIVGTGTDDDPFRPDVPEGVSWEAEIPSELDPKSPRLGQPANKHALVRVPAEAVPQGGIKNAVPADKVPDEERLLVELCRAVSDRSDATLRSGASLRSTSLSDRVRSVMLREAHCAKTPEGRGMLKRLLVHMVRRGLAAETAQAIAREHGL